MIDAMPMSVLKTASISSLPAPPQDPLIRPHWLAPLWRTASVTEYQV